MIDVKLEGLVKYFGEVTAVDDVSLTINKGEVVTLLGPSGCGKTTTLNMIAGFERPDAGNIYVGERLISSVAKRVFVPPHRRNLGMVFQSYGLWPHLTVARNVGFGLEMHGIARTELQQRINEALRLVRLDDFGDRYPSQLSGGQQQRVAFARAIAYQPDVLLLDEPLSNLDAALREEMRLELMELQAKTGHTAIFVTHDQVEAMVMSDRVVVMNEGRIEQVGTPDEIYEHPNSRFVAGFIGIANFLEGELAEAQNNVGLGFVRVGDQLLQCSVENEKVGEKVLLSVRPENWHVSTSAPLDAGPNLFQNPVSKIVYLGGTREIWIDMGGQQVRVHATHLSELEPGALLYHWVSPEYVRSIPC